MNTTNRERNFQAFIGETIVSIDASSINVVHFHTASGKIISVDAEETHYNIPVISINDWREAK